METRTQSLNFIVKEMEVHYIISRSKDPLDWPLEWWRRILFLFLKAIGFRVEIIPTGYYDRSSSTALLYLNNIYTNVDGNFELFCTKVSSSYLHEYLHHLGLNEVAVARFTGERWVSRITFKPKMENVLVIALTL